LIRDFYMFWQNNKKNVFKTHSCLNYNICIPSSYIKEGWISKSSLLFLIFYLVNKSFIDFLDKLGRFIGEKPVALPSIKQCCLEHSFYSFQPRHFSSFRVSNTLVLRGTYCFFSPFDEFLRVALKQKFGYF
jgi:hypothetical protein